jgi:integrase
MTRKELTAKAIESVKPPRSGRVEIWDSRVPGFGLRVAASGAMAWVVMTRIKGRQVRKTLPGRPYLEAVEDNGRRGKRLAGFGLAEARQLAGAVKDAAREGRDLLAEMQAEQDAGRKQEEAKRKAVKTFGDLVKDYCLREIPHLSRGWEVESTIDRELLPNWGDRELAEIGKVDVREITNAVLDAGKPAAANKLFEIIRRLFNWAIKQGNYGVDHSPCDRMDPPAKKVERDRVLTDDEIRALWAAGEALGYPFGPFFQLLLLLGQRLNEVAGMQWSEIDWKESVWTIPVERCKSKRPHLVPLSSSAVAILQSLPRFAGPHAFTTTAGKRPISGFHKAKERLDQLGGIEAHYRIHDLRRTVRTRLAKLGVVEVVAERVINHAPRGLSRIYDQWGYLPEKRAALEAWAGMLRDILEPQPENVVTLEARS